jgi:DNA replication ATP-dependent helicase Dna2
VCLQVRTLVCRGKRVLITSYTHSAVDNLLLKLREKGVHFLRLGRPSQVGHRPLGYTVLAFLHFNRDPLTFTDRCIC